MQKGQGLLQPQQQQQGAKAGVAGGVDAASSTSLAGSAPPISISISVSSPSYNAPPPPSASRPPSPSPAPNSSFSRSNSASNPSSPAPSPRHPLPLPLSNPNPSIKPHIVPPSDFHHFPPSQRFGTPQHQQQQHQQQQWQHQMQQLQQQAQQHHLQQQHHMHQQQQGQQHQPSHHMQQQYRKDVPGEQFPSYQSPIFQGAGAINNSNGSTGPSLPQSRVFNDAQLQSEAVVEPSPPANQIYGQQAIFSAQKKAQTNSHHGKTMISAQQTGTQSVEEANTSLQNQRQVQGRQGKGTGQFLSADQHMDRAPEPKNEANSGRMQAGYLANTMRPPISTHQQALTNGQNHMGLPPMPLGQSHHLDPSTGSLLQAQTPQFMHPQLLAQFGAMQKSAPETSLGLQHLHQMSPKIQDVVMRNLSSPVAQQLGNMTPEVHPSPMTMLGKGNQGAPSGYMSSPTLRQQQSTDYSIEKGVLSLNKTAATVSGPSIPSIASKGSMAGPLPSRSLDKGSGTTGDDAEIQYLRQQQLQSSHSTTQVSNPLVQQVNFGQQVQQQQDPEHPQSLQLQQQLHHPHILYPHVGHQNLQQQQLKQSLPQPPAHLQSQPQQRPPYSQLQSQPQSQLQQQSLSQPKPQPLIPKPPNLQPQLQPHVQPQSACFTRQQLMILRSQIIAFRRLKRGESIPPEVMKSLGIDRSPLPLSIDASLSAGKDVMDKQNIASASHSSQQLELKNQKGGTHLEMPAAKAQQSQASLSKQEEIQATRLEGESTHASECQGNSNEPAAKDDSSLISSNVNLANQTCSSNSAAAGLPIKKPVPVSPNQQKPVQPPRRYRGPLFDFPPIGRRIDNLFQNNNPWGHPIPLGYDVRQLLSKEGVRVINRKKMERLRLIDALLASGLDKKCIPAELITKLRIEQKKLRLMTLQSRVRDEVEEQQQDIMTMGERGYRKFVRFCERQRYELARQVIQLQKSTREKQLKSLLSWRKRLFEAHWAVRDARTTRNRAVLKYHERMLREFSKRRDEDRNKRMEALKNNDVDTYREMLKQQQTKLPGDAGERFQVLSSFLSQTEEYLHKLGGKIAAVKYQQEREEAAVTAVLAAKAQGLSDEEIEAAAAQAREEVSARLQSPDRASDSVSKYYNLAHAVNERIVRQPSMLRAGILRDYQLVGLQWMLSLYNNRLNGILADEMGLGKTVQVMALIAYLMEFKANYGPHLIIVPNAVIVNWKSELLRWIPSVSCIFYVGGKEQRTKLYSQEVCARKFNVLVTTYEFIMRDRSKLSKIDWKYLIIDEAQRMKDRESRLSRDLDRFRCQRRLLLTGTPLQNDLRELWSLLNLLLPEVFDNSKSFQDWFSMPFQRDSTSLSPEDDWLETEKKVIVIHRLHQILEPFMLRRRVEDVEGSLPPKVPIVLKCKMSALQAAIYDWIKATGTIRLDPRDEEMRVAAKNGKRQKRAYAPLQNKCMELRKVCNHPLLNYPFFSERMNEFSVRSCGKLWILDRILMKLHCTGHRVLLFSTMTKLLDILEDYLQWRGLSYRRIDGTTTLESREAAIVEFNRAESDCFIFLLSIRAAGRGLNLQTADTVIIYDPDPNPKNEEQAVARAHRIGQKREVRVIYMEAVVETITSFEKEDEIRSGGHIDSEDDDMAGKDRYVGSVESLVRNTIQQHKIEMADEVINAGRFDQRTTHEERRLTLEALLHDEDRYQERVHDVPSLQEVNRMIARSEEEVEYFDQMDEEYQWPGEMLQHHQIPKWLCVGSREVRAAVDAMSKQASKKGISEVFGTAEAEERLRLEQPDKVSFRKRETSSEMKNDLQNSSKKKITIECGKSSSAMEVAEDIPQRDSFDEEDEDEEEEEEDDDEEDQEEEEEGEIRIEETEAVVTQMNGPEEGEVSEEELGAMQSNCEALVMKVVEKLETTVENALESSQEEDVCRNEEEFVLLSPVSQQKFGSLAALDSRPNAQSAVEELEEGEIAASGDSHFEAQPSGSSAQDPDEGDEQQAIHRLTKRKRSARLPRRRPLEKVGISGGAITIERKLPYPFSQTPIQRPPHEFEKQLYASTERGTNRNAPKFHENDRLIESISRRSDHSVPPAKRRQILESSHGRKTVETFSSQQSLATTKHSKISGIPEYFNDKLDSHKDSGKLITRFNSAPTGMIQARMPENIQKKCKAVLQRLKGVVEKDGHQANIIFELPKRNESPGYYKVITNPIDAQTIEQKLERLEYGTVIDFAADVLLMLDNAARFYKSPEVKAYIRKLQALYIQRMHHNFPETDFGPLKTRNLAALSQTALSSASPRMPIITGRPQAEATVSSMPRPVMKANATNEERMPNRSSLVDNKRPVKKAKVAPVIVPKSSERIKMKLEHGKGNGTDSGELRHPLDLVFRKKKRKQRGRTVNKIRTINFVSSFDGKNSSSKTPAQDSDARVGVKVVGKKIRTVGISSSDAKKHPVTALRTGAHMVGILPTPASAQRNLEKVQVQPLNRASVSMGSGQWLVTPVKKMRTDGGKRRPSYV